MGYNWDSENPPTLREGEGCLWLVAVGVVGLLAVVAGIAYAVL